MTLGDKASFTGLLFMLPLYHSKMSYIWINSRMSHADCISIYQIPLRSNCINITKSGFPKFSLPTQYVIPINQREGQNSFIVTTALRFRVTENMIHSL